MPPDNTHPVRRCAPCDRDWPNTSFFNICPRCQRNCYASTAGDLPSSRKAKEDAERYQRYRDFDAQVDSGAFKLVPDAWVDEMEALLAQTPTIPDPDPPRGDKPYPFSRWDGDDA